MLCIMRLVLTPLLSLLLFGHDDGQTLQSTNLLVNGIGLHYIEQGHGSPRENPEALEEAVYRFLSGHKR